jgi:DNA-binding LacI/PurR family transcriptional regulator/serine phosphatase RsbU (regulator of sigma subunit)
MFLRGSDYTYQNEIVLGAHDECQEHGVDLYCFAGGLIDANDPRNVVYGLCGPTDLDAVILVTGTMANEDSPEIERLLQRFAGLPVCTIGSAPRGIASIGVDNVSGVRELTRHLIERHQRRRIAFVTGPNHESERRLDGYREALKACGLAYDERLVLPGDFTPPSGARAVASLFDSGDACDALVAANDWMALGALNALTARGLRVPEDVALVGFDDIEECRFVTPALTTVRQPPRQLGMRAVRTVLSLRDATEDASAVLLPTATLIRQSCGCHGPKPDLELDVPSPGQALLSALGSSREAWILALRNATPLLDQELGDPEIETNVAERLVDALLGDLQHGTEHRFVMAVEGLVRQSADLGNIAAWHQTISRLRCETVTSLSGSVRPWLRAETVFAEAQLLVSSLAEHAQAKRRLEKEQLMRSLEEMSVAVRAVVDVPSLRQALVSQLPDLRIASLYVALYCDTPGPDANSRLVLAYDDETQLKTEAHERLFRTGEILPPDLRPPWRHSVLVQSLFLKERPLGFCAIEIGSRDGSVFRTIPELISNALQAIELENAISGETREREQVEQARRSREVELAARVQLGILPTELAAPGLEISLAMSPACDVGSDYLELLPVEGGCWLGIGDVAGQGFYTGLVRSMVQSIVAATLLSRPEATPAQAWTTLNSVLYDNVRRRLQRDEHARIALLRYHADGRLQFAGAHEELVIYRAAQHACEVVLTPGMAAGTLPSAAPAQVEHGECRLHPGDVLLLYTDGVTQAENAEMGAYGLTRLRQSLLEVSARPVQEIRDHILFGLRGWTSQVRDDLTLVVLRYRGAL